MSIKERLSKAQGLLKEKNLDYLIIEDPISLFYMTNISMSMGKLIISQTNATLFVDGRYIEAAKQNEVCPAVLINEKALSEFLLENTNQNAKIAIDSVKTPLITYQKLIKFLEKIKNNNSNFDFEIIPIENPLRPLREIKDLDEISKMKKSCALNWLGFEHICLLLKEGVSEKELALEYEIFVKKNGADALAFDPIVAFGEHSAMPHHNPSDRKLKLNDVVLLDIGANFEKYNSDMTRVIFFGAVNPEIEKMYNIVKRAQGAAVSICRPGITIKELDLAAREVLKQEDMEQYFTHTLGHGIGLETHEFFKMKFDCEEKDLQLKPGMVITIEPGVYKPGIGGVRYEDMILITSDGYENLYSSL